MKFLKYGRFPNLFTCTTFLISIHNYIIFIEDLWQGNLKVILFSIAAEFFNATFIEFCFFIDTDSAVEIKNAKLLKNVIIYYEI